MSQYLLSVHSVPDGAPQEQLSAGQMQEFMDRVGALEAEMRATDTFVFGGRLHDADAATVVRLADDDLVMTDGPFVESKQHIGGFSLMDPADLDEALGWAGRVVRAIEAPIEVRPFASRPAAEECRGRTPPRAGSRSSSRSSERCTAKPSPR